MALLLYDKAKWRPKFNALPTIVGTAEVGQILSVSYEVANATSEVVRWVCYNPDMSGEQILQDAAQYQVANQLVGKVLAVRVIATNSFGGVTEESGPTDAVPAVPLPAPSFTQDPVIQGVAESGETISVAYQVSNAVSEGIEWRTYTGASGQGELVAGVGPTFTLTDDHVNLRLTATVVADNGEGITVSRTSSLFGPVIIPGVDAGAPTLPLKTASPLPPAGWDKPVADVVLTSASNLQTWLNANAPIDTRGGVFVIEMQAGDVWSHWDTVTVPQNLNSYIDELGNVVAGPNYIVFRTSNYQNLPAEGNRLQPSPANDDDLATIVGPTVTRVRSIATVSYPNTGNRVTITTTEPHGIATSQYMWVSGIECWNRQEESNNYFEGIQRCYRVDDTTLYYDMLYSQVGLTPTLNDGKIAGGRESSYIIQNGSSGYLTKVAFVGIKFMPAEHAFAYQNVYFGGSNREVMFYQCRFSTEPDRRIRDTMLMINGQDNVVSCCDFNVRRRDYFAPRRPSGFKVVPGDGCFSIRTTWGSGLRVYNNRLQSGGCSMFLADNNNNFLVRTSPSDMTIDKNYMVRPVEWLDLDTHKNAFEIKGVNRLLMEGNIIEFTYDGWQPPAHLCVVKSNYNVTYDVLIRNNIFRSGAAGLMIEAKASGANDVVTRCTFSNNLVYDLDRNLSNNPDNITTARVIYCTGAARDPRWIGNTFVCSDGYGAVLTYSGQTIGTSPLQRPQIRDNVFAASKNPPYGDSKYRFMTISGPTRSGLYAINGDMQDWYIGYNLFTYMSADGLNGDTTNQVEAGATLDVNYYEPTNATAGFADFENGDYRIVSGPYATGSSTGGPVGANIPVVLAATNNVETGLLS